MCPGGLQRWLPHWPSYASPLGETAAGSRRYLRQGWARARDQLCPDTLDQLPACSCLHSAGTCELEAKSCVTVLSW